MNKIFIPCEVTEWRRPVSRSIEKTTVCLFVDQLVHLFLPLTWQVLKLLSRYTIAVTDCGYCYSPVPRYNTMTDSQHTIKYMVLPWLQLVAATSCSHDRTVCSPYVVLCSAADVEDSRRETMIVNGMHVSTSRPVTCDTTLPVTRRLDHQLPATGALPVLPPS